MQIKMYNYNELVLYRGFVMGIFDKLHNKIDKLDTKLNEANDYIVKKSEELSKGELKFQKKTSVETESTNTKKRREDTTKSRKDMDASTIDEMQRIPASEKYCNIVCSRYYSEYPEKPYISKDRECNTNWLEQAERFPIQSIVSIEKMIRFDDNLLPGHIYLLYWLGKKKQTGRIPAYFEYRYGIDAIKEISILTDAGYLEENKPTEKGIEAIVAHYDVIENH